MILDFERKRAFTLVEIIITIAIIGIIATSVASLTSESGNDTAINAKNVNTVARAQVAAELRREIQGSYSGVCSNGKVSSILDVVRGSLDEADDFSRDDLKCIDAGGRSYAIIFPVLGKTSTFRCVTSHEDSKEISMTLNEPSGNVRGVVYKCESGSGDTIATTEVGRGARPSPTTTPSTPPLPPQPVTRVYATEDTGNYIYELNITTGIATRITDSNVINLASEDPGDNLEDEKLRGLSSYNGTLYMLGATMDALYTLDKEDGIIATRVGNATTFGINEKFPTGLAFHSDGTLYMTGKANRKLYKLNKETGVATRPGLQDFGAFIRSPQGLTFHREGSDEKLYMLGILHNSSGGHARLFTVNTSTGKATRVGSLNDFGVGENKPSAILSLNENLYMTGADTDKLYRLNTTTGQATAVDNTVVNFGIVGIDPKIQGLAAITE